VLYIHRAQNSVTCPKLASLYQELTRPTASFAISWFSPFLIRHNFLVRQSLYFNTVLNSQYAIANTKSTHEHTPTPRILRPVSEFEFGSDHLQNQAKEVFSIMIARHGCISLHVACISVTILLFPLASLHVPGILFPFIPRFYPTCLLTSTSTCQSPTTHLISERIAKRIPHS
jgi:hypothetical protein